MPTVTSHNKAEFDREFLKQKGLLKEEEKEEKEDKTNVREMAIQQVARAKRHPKYAKLRASLGHKGAVEAILKELNEKQ